MIMPALLALGVDLGHRPLAPEPHVQPADAQALKVLDALDDGQVAEPEIEVTGQFHGDASWS